jgi:hypothetical protein
MQNFNVDFKRIRFRVGTYFGSLDEKGGTPFTSYDVPISRKEHMESNPNLIRWRNVPSLFGGMPFAFLFDADFWELGPLASKVHLLNKAISKYWRKKQSAKAVRSAVQLDLVTSFMLRTMM